MFILVTPEKLTLTVARSLQTKIRPFTSYSNLVTAYTDKGAHVAKKNHTAQQFLQLLDTHVFDRSYIYRAQLTANELTLAKLAMPHECRVYVTTERFIDSTLPILDLMVATTSERPTVQMDVWLPSEDRDQLKAIIESLDKAQLDTKRLMQLAAKLYNQNAPKALADAQHLQKIVRHSDDRRSHFTISRNVIANLIRSGYITTCVRRYSASAAHELGVHDIAGLEGLQGV
jgi:hypothetical protein